MKRIWSETAIRWAVAGSLALLIALPASFAQAPAEPDSGMPATQPATLLSPGQLDDLVAPIALYPDPLLSQVLVASTYPLEIVEAQQWLTQNRGLQGQALMDAARQQNWDASVQAMVAFPDVLTMHEPGRPMDHGIGQCVSGAAVGRDGSCAADARAGASQWQAHFDSAADGYQPRRRTGRRPLTSRRPIRR